MVVDGARVDHVFTDPPYDERTHANTLTEDPGGDGPRAMLDFAPFTPGDMDTFLSLAAQVVRRWVVFTCERRYAAQVEQHPPEGLRFVQMGAYIRENATPSFCGLKPACGFDLVCILHREDEPLRWNGGGGHAVWTHQVPRGAAAFGHHTQKPLGLGLEWVRLFSDPGELILDPFTGSGTFPDAAKRLGRRAIACELDMRWFDVARHRLSQGSLFGGTQE
jgi:hypothetical protein